MTIEIKKNADNTVIEIIGRLEITTFEKLKDF